ncbi:MAG TPA: response regulator [Abditibacteriaceae bacterium]
MNALILDDNLMSAMRLDAQLSRGGYTTKTSRDLTDGEFDLVLINIGSRNLDGPSLVQEARERIPAARVVGFCGHLEVEIRRAAKAANIDKILTNDQALSNLIASL